MSPFWINNSEILSRLGTQARSTAASDPVTVQSQSSIGKGKSSDLGGNNGELSYHGSIRGKTKLSLGSSVSSETEEGATGVASPRTGGGATGVSTTISVDAAGTTAGVFDLSPVLG
jgi:hypothetical protein